MSVKENSPVTYLIERAKGAAHRLCPPDGSRAHYQTTDDRDRDRDILTTTHWELFAPMAVAFNNGGLPAKRGGKSHKILGREVPGEVLAANIWRTVIVALLVWNGWKAGGTVTVAPDGVTFTPPAREAKP